MVPNEVYVSIDVESDGPAPGVYSMLAVGAAAFNPDGAELGTWYAKLYPLDGALADPDTMRWWESQPEAYAEVQRDRQEPGEAIRRFANWLDMLSKNHGKLIAVGWPIAFDFAFVNWYLHRFAGRNPLGFSGLDIRTYADGLCNWPAYGGLPTAVTKRLIGSIDKTGLRPHVAVDDAIEQGRLFIALRREAQRRYNEVH